jgi:general secretion pathway protein A
VLCVIARPREDRMPWTERHIYCLATLNFKCARAHFKWNPFTLEVPTEALYVPPKVENFCWRIEQAHLREGGFALIHGEPGSGKSVVMRQLAERLARLADLLVGVIHHPQSNLSDFYRELGNIFSISIRVSNRWGGFKALRARWLDHLGSASRRPVVLVDEAQEMTPMVLFELRLLASARFDSQSLLCVVLSGDARLLDKLRREELIPLGSRIRTRLATGVAPPRRASGLPRTSAHHRRQCEPHDQAAAKYPV